MMRVTPDFMKQQAESAGEGRGGDHGAGEASAISRISQDRRG